ncbi:hypothetical protein DE146DRAFT_2291 [Phaeosphaeria sp. MPI-PUGE-AT-0046c]|nr:hypothetical protein DE146DRAFT_2291 [Phaeosphaeria sp. MPI-PUGE-AT-0046c]
MRVFVFGALLARTLNAQVSDAGNDGTATAVSLPAPLSTDSDARIAVGDAVSTGDALLLGTADVIVDTTPTDTTSVEPTITEDDFGVGETEGPGVEFNGSNFILPTASVSDIASDEESTAVDEPFEQATASEEFGLGRVATATPDAVGLVLGTSGTTTIDDFGAESPEATPVEDLTESDQLLGAIPTESPIAEPEIGTDSTNLDEEPEDLAAAIPAPDVDTILLSDTDSQAEPVNDAEDTETSSLALPEDGETAVAPEPVDELIEPVAAESSPKAGGVSAAYADDGNSGTWTGDDVGQYDGQDVEDEECPAYCYEEDDDESDGKTSTYSAEDNEDEDQKEEGSDDEESFVKRVVRWISRRALSSSFAWPIDKNDKTATYDPEAEVEDCDEDLPEWVYEAADKEPESCPAPKDKCPAKCYEHGTSPKPYPVSSIPGGYETYSTPAPSSIGGYSPIPEYSSAKQEYTPYPVSSILAGYEPYSMPAASSIGGYSPIPEYSSAKQEYTPYPVPDESTTGYYENTATSTQTTFVTSTTAAAGGYKDSEAHADYTGDTLDSICPKTCDPFNPAANKCDITSSCTTTGKGKYYCACRAGFRASAWNAKDFSKQFKFPDQPYVYTAEGVVCDTVCSDQTCTEVMSRPQCQ